MKQISIKTKIFIMLSSFAIVLLAVLWLFLIGGLNLSYKTVKNYEAKLVMHQVENNILTEEAEKALENIEQLAAQNNMNIYITDSNGNELFSVQYLSNSQLRGMQGTVFEYFYKEAKENGGTAVMTFKGNELRQFIEEKQLENFMKYFEGFFGSEFDSFTRRQNQFIREFNFPSDISEGLRQNKGSKESESVIYISCVNTAAGERVIMLNSELTPVDSIVSTLEVLMLMMTLFALVLAATVAYFSSKLITKSLISVNESARKLAEGDFQVQFDGRDYLEVSQLSDTLNYAAAELNKTESLREELIANVSHDLRTPLTMIKGYAEVMRDIPGENTPENTQVIIDETEHLTGLVNDMLDISKLRAKTIVLEPRTYNLTEGIFTVLNRYNKLKEQEGYIIDFIYEDEAFVTADEAKMEQVIYNLVNNAINYTGEDKRVIVRQSVIGDKVRIEVTDSGEGIAKEDIPYIWDRYYKVDKNHRRAISGTGLGLSIVKKVLELHEAKYGVTSEVGCGSTFWFEIKICR